MSLEVRELCVGAVTVAVVAVAVGKTHALVVTPSTGSPATTICAARALDKRFASG